MDKNTTYLGRPARKMKPTQSHRPAVWEMMLGTVRAMSDEVNDDVYKTHPVEYFDYDHDAAFEFSGYSEDRDPRVWRFDGCHWGIADYLDAPRKGQLVLFIK